MRPDGRSQDSLGASSAAFPADLLGQSAARLRILALLYAFVFFMAGMFPMLLVPGGSGAVRRELRAMGAGRHLDRGGAPRGGR